MGQPEREWNERGYRECENGGVGGVQCWWGGWGWRSVRPALVINPDRNRIVSVNGFVDLEIDTTR